MNYIDQARNLLANLNQRMSPSIYDVGWLARLKDADGAPRWPALQDWLLSRQKDDGSWGSGIRHYHHDRIICTLIAAIALAENGEGPAASSAISRARQFIWQNTHLLYRDPATAELVGFELLFPTLMLEAQVLGLNLPKHTYGYGKIKTEKLRLIPSQMLFSSQVTTVHSLEFLGPNVSPKNLEKALFRNGSLGNSPAATAYYIHLSMLKGVDYSPASDAYIARAMSHVDPVLYLYPFRNFEMMWVLNNFLMINHDFPQQSLVPPGLIDLILAQMGESGIGLDGEFGIPDGDCTSVALYLLQSMGYEADPVILAHYEVPDADIFRTYNYERNPSVSTNIHALEAIRMMGDYPNRDEKIAGITNMLLQNRHYGLYWTDKWHASPFYATSHALIALLKADPRTIHTCADAIEWLVNIQRPDGSWGFFDRGTAEETAYVLLALQHAGLQMPISRDVIHRGIDYLLEHAELEVDGYQYPELWLGKCLYSPYDIVKSAILSALIQHEHTS